MKTIEDIRLEAKVSDMIVELVRQGRDGELEEVDDGDLDSLCTVRAMEIIKLVKEAA